tara:strand:- start:758 stop:1312 length:555 start_codon:yes stop_codon:yes gene_type:complete
MLTVYSLNPDKRLSITIAVFFAEDVLHIWEAEFPEDMRPRKAIETAKAWIVSPGRETAAVASTTYHDAHNIISSTEVKYDGTSYAASAALAAGYAGYAAYAAYAAGPSIYATYAAENAARQASTAQVPSSNRMIYTHKKLTQLLPHILEYKLHAKTSFKDPEQVFDLLSEENQQRFLFGLNHLV